MYLHMSYDDCDVITIRRQFVFGLKEYIARCPYTRWRKGSKGWQIVVTGSKEIRREVCIWIEMMKNEYRPTEDEQERHWEKLRRLK